MVLPFFPMLRQMSNCKLSNVYPYLCKARRKIGVLLRISLKRSIRKIGMKRDILKMTYFNSGAKLRLFNLDLHIGVIRDLEQELMNHVNIDLVSWSISRHNGLIRNFLNIPDPVKHVNNKTWSSLNPAIRNEFIIEYSGFLKKFDGFIVTHTQSFIQLFECLNKPILLLNATRYEAPYSNDLSQWSSLNESLRKLSESKLLHIGSNNKGDQEYLFRNTSINSFIVPSVCDYLSPSRESESSIGLIFCRSAHFQNYIERITGGRFKTTYGRYVSYEEIIQASSIVVVPQNISTMFLFEMATLGKRVLIPEINLLKDLAQKVPGVLSELSYFQIHGLSTEGLANDDLNNYASPVFYDQWLGFADFYDLNLMPNVELFEDFSELQHYSSAYIPDQQTNVRRNKSLRDKRANFVNSFIQKL